MSMYGEIIVENEKLVMAKANECGEGAGRGGV